MCQTIRDQWPSLEGSCAAGLWCLELLGWWELREHRTLEERQAGDCGYCAGPRPQDCRLVRDVFEALQKTFG